MGKSACIHALTLTHTHAVDLVNSARIHSPTLKHTHTEDVGKSARIHALTLTHMHPKIWVSLHAYIHTH